MTELSMLPLDDLRWSTLRGGYHLLYDASAPLRKLYAQGVTQEIWDELWQELHHQGGVDTASYAAVPHLLEFARHSPRLDWNVFGLIATIELERPHNPDPTPDLAEGYFQALQALPQVVGSHPDRDWDSTLTRCIVGCIALARGQRVLARAYLEMDEDVAKRWLKEELDWEEGIFGL